MPYGVGGLLGDLMHPDLNAQLGRAISPTPNPLPGPGGGGGAPNAPPSSTGGQGAAPAPGAQGSQPPGPQANLAPIQLPAPDPVNQQNIGELILNAQRERDAEQGLNYGLHEIAAGFGTAGQQASKQEALRGYPQSGDNLVNQLSGIQGIQQTQFENQQKQNALAAMLNPQLFKDLQGYGYTPAELTALAYSGKLPEVLTTVMGIGGDATMQAMNHDRMVWVQQHQAKDAQGNPVPGQYVDAQGNPTTMPDELTNVAKYKGKTEAQGKLLTDQAQDLAEAQKATPGMLTKIDEAERLVNQLKSDPTSLDAALKFMSTPLLNQGPDQAVKSGLITQKTYNAIAAIQQLSGQVYGQGFASTGSKRTQQEVAAIVSGLSQLKNVGYSGSDYIKNALNPLQAQFDKARANGLAAAQRLDEIPVSQRGLADPSYLPGGALYNGKGGAWANDIALNPDEETAAHSMIDSGQATREQVRQHILSEGKRPPPWLANG